MNIPSDKVALINPEVLQTAKSMIASTNDMIKGSNLTINQDTKASVINISDADLPNHDSIINPQKMELLV